MQHPDGYVFQIAANLQTPTLIMMGNPTKGATSALPWEVVFSILRAHNVAARMLIFNDEGHGHETKASALLAFQEMQRWMEQHVQYPHP